MHHNPFNYFTLPSTMPKTISRPRGSPDGQMGYEKQKRKWDGGTTTKGALANRPSKKTKTADLSLVHNVLAPVIDIIEPLNDPLNEPKNTQEPPASATNVPAAIAGLEATHTITSINIISSSHIQQKVTRILEILATFSFVPGSKPNIVLLTSKASVASKMISITEIAKREIAQKGGKWFQYNVIEASMVEQPVLPGNGKGGFWDPKKDVDAMEIEEDESAFEPMKTPFERAIEGRPKVRATPSMSIYLSRIRVESLKKTYG